MPPSSFVAKQALRMVVTSRQEDDSGALLEEQVQALDATLSQGPGSCYLRFEADGVNATLRLAQGELRLIRRGVMDHWQVHREGEWTSGSLDLGGGALALVVHTQRLEWELEPGGKGQLHLRYVLYDAGHEDSDTDEAGAQSLGLFTLTLVWQPQADAEHS